MEASEKEPLFVPARSATRRAEDGGEGTADPLRRGTGGRGGGRVVSGWRMRRTSKAKFHTSKAKEDARASTRNAWILLHDQPEQTDTSRPRGGASTDGKEGHTWSSPATRTTSHEFGAKRTRKMVPLLASTMQICHVVEAPFPSACGTVRGRFQANEGPTSHEDEDHLCLLRFFAFDDLSRPLVRSSICSPSSCDGCSTAWVISGSEWQTPRPGRPRA